jgi:hypothetical protein
VADPYGWRSDPFGLHEQRYFSQDQPTKLVRDGTVEAYDPPPSETPNLMEHAVEPSGAPLLRLDPQPALPPPPSTWQSSWTPPPASIDQTSKGRKNHVARLAAGAAALILVLVVAIVWPFSSSNASAALVAASTHTAEQGTVTLSGRITVTTSGQQQVAAIDLNGAENFATHAVEMQLSETPETGTFSIRDVAGIEYVESPLFDLPGGATWVEITRSDLGVNQSGVSATNFDSLPLEGLQFLAGVNSANEEGTAQIEGVGVTKYSFTLDLGSIARILGEQLQHLGPPACPGNQGARFKGRPRSRPRICLARQLRPGASAEPVLDHS